MIENIKNKIMNLIWSDGFSIVYPILVVIFMVNIIEVLGQKMFEALSIFGVLFLVWATVVKGRDGESFFKREIDCDALLEFPFFFISAVSVIGVLSLIF